jgi:2,3-bisphosphoglycerate-independent phosphoglycerate mutase
MKYVIIQGDGMGDEPIAALGNRTPLEAARTPNFDRVAGRGRLGLLHTIPDGLPPGSDVGNLSLFGYDPREFYTGRSPLEAASMGVALGPEDVSFRMNLVTLGKNGASPAGNADVMEDYSGGHIETGQAALMVRSIAAELSTDDVQFYPGVSYRHLVVWRHGEIGMKTTPPHDISGQAIAKYLPEGVGSERLREIMRRSREILATHPENQKRVQAGQKPITQGWLWGQGKAPQMAYFRERHGLKGACISAVDLVRGVAVYAGFDIIMVPGATGFLDTNYRGKGQYALKALADHDLIFVHIEAPDEAGHMGNAEEKVKAIEAIDREVVGPMLDQLPKLGPFKILITSDHATPVARKTHVAAAVPFAMATGEQLKNANAPLKYGETEAAKTGVEIREGFRVIEVLKGYPE